MTAASTEQFNSERAPGPIGVWTEDLPADLTYYASYAGPLAVPGLVQPSVMGHESIATHNAAVHQDRQISPDGADNVVTLRRQHLDHICHDTSAHVEIVVDELAMLLPKYRPAIMFDAAVSLRQFHAKDDTSVLTSHTTDSLRPRQAV